MLIVDASCLYEIVADTDDAEQIRALLGRDPDFGAPHVVDVEVLGAVRRDHVLGRLDATAARQAVSELRIWPGQRFDHRPLLERAWDLRDNVRRWDAIYVALAEALDATLITRDRRIAGAYGVRCRIEAV
jgi:predicted nucleic acid-binding protein